MAAREVPTLTICDQWDQGAATVTVRGELDGATADAFGRRLAHVADRSPRRLVIDLAGVGFLDSARLSAFVRLPKALPADCAVILRPTSSGPASLRPDRPGGRIRVRVNRLPRRDREVRPQWQGRGRCAKATTSTGTPTCHGSPSAPRPRPPPRPARLTAVLRSCSVRGARPALAGCGPVRSPARDWVRLAPCSSACRAR